MNIIVTGSNSTIGINLISKLIRLGHGVIKLGDRSMDKWRLGDFIPSQKNTDVLIHLAYDRNFNLNQNIYAVEKFVNPLMVKKYFCLLCLPIQIQYRNMDSQSLHKKVFF
jgi:nucleoside-diphosphate-sugar epimerase